MINLAGQTKADLIILEELDKANIEIVEGKKSRGEVPYTLTGKLGNWKFERAWYYWIAEAQKGEGLTLEVATALHNRKYPVKGEKQPNTYGQVIRVDGDAGCPVPSCSVAYYHVDTQEGLNALAKAVRTSHVDALRDKFSKQYTNWTVSNNENGVEWFKKLLNIAYDNIKVNELFVAIGDKREVLSIGKKWESEQGRGIAQYFFKTGQITGFNYGRISGSGQPLNRGPEIDDKLRPHFEELGAVRSKSRDSLENCLDLLELPGPNYVGKC